MDEETAAAAIETTALPTTCTATATAVPPAITTADSSDDMSVELEGGAAPTDTNMTEPCSGITVTEQPLKLHFQNKITDIDKNEFMMKAKAFLRHISGFPCFDQRNKGCFTKCPCLSKHGSSLVDPKHCCKNSLPTSDSFRRCKRTCYKGLHSKWKKIVTESRPREKKHLPPYALPSVFLNNQSKKPRFLLPKCLDYFFQC